MVKHELVKLIKENMENPVPHPVISDVLTTLSLVIKDSLENGEEVPLEKLGVFYTKERKERRGEIRQSPRKGEISITPAHTRPAFRLYPSFKNYLK